jgi:hypothetical protein
MKAAQQWPCVVCGEPADETNSAICNACGQRFHLNLRSDRPGKDCGEVWVNDLYSALEFACFNCLRGRTASPQADKKRLRRASQRARTVRRRYRRRE